MARFLKFINLDQCILMLKKMGQNGQVKMTKELQK